MEERTIGEAGGVQGERGTLGDLIKGWDVGDVDGLESHCQGRLLQAAGSGQRAGGKNKKGTKDRAGIMVIVGRRVVVGGI